MSTSAKTLHGLLVKASKYADTMTLAEALCDILGLESVEIGKAVLVVQDLAFEIDKQLKSEYFDDAERRHIEGYFGGFRTLINFQAYGQQLKILKTTHGILNGGKISHMLTVHALLKGVIGPAVITNVDSILKTLSELRKEVSSSELPSDLKEAIFKRLSDINVAIENFEAFGVESIVESVSTLIGEIQLFATPEDFNNPKNKSTYSGVYKFATTLFDGIETVDEKTDSAISLAKKTKLAAKILGPLLGVPT